MSRFKVTFKDMNGSQNNWIITADDLEWANKWWTVAKGQRSLVEIVEVSTNEETLKVN